MEGPTVLGRALDAVFTGRLDNASVRENLATDVRGATISTASQGQPTEIGWLFAHSGGAGAIYARYASVAETPCELWVNGDLVQSHALFECTGHHKAIDCRYQAEVSLRPGGNEVRLRSQGAFPFFYELVVAGPPDAQVVPVDEYWARLQSDGESAGPPSDALLNPADFRTLVDRMTGSGRLDAKRRAYARVLPHLVDAVARDSVSGQERISFSGPMNGQIFRQKTFDRLLRLGVDVLVETGAFKGATTAFLARQGLPVFACEIREAFLAAAILQVTQYDHVRFLLEDSRAFLRNLADDPAWDFRLPFFYLDAHWEADLPLAEEIKIISDRWPDFIIMVDDFQVPGTKYGFDDYGPGAALTLPYLQDHGVPLDKMAVLFPTAVWEAETGMRRGTLVLTQEGLYERRLKDERTLYRHPV